MNFVVAMAIDLSEMALQEVPLPCLCMLRQCKYQLKLIVLCLLINSKLTRNSVVIKSKLSRNSVPSIMSIVNVLFLWHLPYSI